MLFKAELLVVYGDTKYVDTDSQIDDWMRKILSK